MSLKCELHKNCKGRVVAKVGLPSFMAIWVCLKGFNEYRESQSA